MNINALVTYHDSKSAIFAAVNNGLGSFRVTSETVLPHIKAILAQVKDDQPEAESLRATLHELPVALAGIGLVSLGSLLDPDVTLPAAGDLGYTISTIGVRGIKVLVEGKEEARNGLAGLAIYPAFSLDAFVAESDGRVWAQSVIDKEVGLVAFRPIRSKPGETTLAELAEGARQMPLAVGDYTTPSAADSSQFDIFKPWVSVRDAMKARQDPLGQLFMAVASMKRDDVLNSIRSKSYAERLFPALEEAKVFINVALAFARIVQIQGKAEADNPDSQFRHDPAIIHRWLEGRDSLDLLPKAATVTTDLSQINLDDFLAG